MQNLIAPEIYAGLKPPVELLQFWIERYKLFYTGKILVVGMLALLISLDL